MPEEAFKLINQYRHLCTEHAILAMYRVAIIDEREAEFLYDLGRDTMISPLQEEWLMAIESRQLQHHARNGIDDNALIERLVQRPRDTRFISWRQRANED